MSQYRTIQINYDLTKPGRDYPRLYDAIKRLANGHARPLESMWLIRTTKTAKQVRDILKQHVDANDKLLVFEVTRDDWASNFRDQHIDWLHGHMGYLRAA